MVLGLDKRWKRWIAIVFGLVVLTIVGPAIVDPIAREIRLSRMPDVERDRSSGVVRLLRGLQMSLADMCYNKSTHYQHSGVRYRIPCQPDIAGEEIKHDQEKFAESESATTATAGAEHAHQGEVAQGEHAHGGPVHEHEHKHPPLIPTKEEDFRGIIGDVEREVKPFSTVHMHHTKPEEALPWLRLATWINPEHEKAWVASAFWLKGTGKAHATSQAIELLKKAIALNPMRDDQPYRKISIRYMLGHIYLEMKDARRALEVLEPTLEHGEKDFAQLDDIQRDWLAFCFRDAAHACRMLARSLQEADYHKHAIEICERGLALFPDDGPLRKTLKREKRLLEKALAAKKAN